MRADLSLIAGTTDAEKLTALVKEKALRMMCSLGRLRRRHRKSTELVTVDEMSRFQNGLAVMMALAEMMERRPDYKAKLVAGVAEWAPRVDAILDKIAKALIEMRPDRATKSLDRNSEK